MCYILTKTWRKQKEDTEVSSQGLKFAALSDFFSSSRLKILIVKSWYEKEMIKPHLFFCSHSISRVVHSCWFQIKNMRVEFKITVQIYIYTALRDFPLILIISYSFTAKFKVIITTSCTELSVSAEAVFSVSKNGCVETATIVSSRLCLSARRTDMFGGKMHARCWKQHCDGRATWPRCSLTSFIQQRSGRDWEDRWTGRPQLDGWWSEYCYPQATV